MAIQGLVLSKEQMLIFMHPPLAMLLLTVSFCLTTSSCVFILLYSADSQRDQVYKGTNRK